MQRAVMLPGVALLFALVACVCAGSGASDPVPTPILDTNPGDSSSSNPTPAGPANSNPPAGDASSLGSGTNDTPIVSTDQIDRVTRASVQILAAQSPNNLNNILWTGSGTIITPQGEIITNCHVACDAPVILIALTDSADLPPTPAYVAQITHADPDIDLAILRLVSDLNGNPVNANLPFLEVGNSNDLRLGDSIRIFGYPGVGGATITFTSGSVSGFESASLPGDGASQRIAIKTDANIASGNSGGTAIDSNGRLIGIPTYVNPDVREGVTIGGIGVLRPVNLVEYVRQTAGGAPPPSGAAAAPPASDPDPFEPNDTFETAVGPLASGESVTAYISWSDDIDAFYFDVVAPGETIQAELINIPSGTDYDLYLFDPAGQIVGQSEGTTSTEFIEYTAAAAGTYWIAVLGYEGSSTTQAYTLTLVYSGGAPSAAAGIAVTGQVVFGTSGLAIGGGTFGVLAPGVSCDAFFNSANPDAGQIVTAGNTDSQGFFELFRVPQGGTYSAFFVLGNDYICEDNWLDVPANATDTDLGVIDINF